MWGYDVDGKRVEEGNVNKFFYSLKVGDEWLILIVKVRSYGSKIVEAVVIYIVFF